MNGIASKIVSALCLLGIIVAIGFAVVRPILQTQEEQLIAEAQEACEKQQRLRTAQEEKIAELREAVSGFEQEKAEREQRRADLQTEMEELKAETEALQGRKAELIEEMNERAAKDRQAYVGREFERFAPGNGRVYENVEVIAVTGEGIKLRSEFGLVTVRADELGDNFHARLRFGLLTDDPPLPAEGSE